MNILPCLFLKYLGIYNYNFSQETLNFLRENAEYNDFVEEFILDTYNIKLR